jgi:hypothetical protein
MARTVTGSGSTTSRNRYPTCEVHARPAGPLRHGTSMWRERKDGVDDLLDLLLGLVS